MKASGQEVGQAWEQTPLVAEEALGLQLQGSA
jgi:hypothetical protein